MEIKATGKPHKEPELLAGAPKPLIPDGSYLAVCKRYDFSIIAKSKKLYLHFKIKENPHIKSSKYKGYAGTELFQAFNLPISGPVESGRKYYKTWVWLNNFQTPSRNASLSPKKFIGKTFIIKTRTCEPKFNGKNTHKSLNYSIIDCLLEVVK